MKYKVYNFGVWFWGLRRTNPLYYFCIFRFGILAVLVLINKMWLQLGILALIYAAMMVVLFAVAEVQAWIDVATDILRRV